MFSVNMNNAATDTCGQVCARTQVSIPLGSIPRCGLAGSYDQRTCAFFRNGPAVSRGGCTVLRSWQLLPVLANTGYCQLSLA